ncbi:MAG TPA: shikimate dehydrogenase [Methylomirabilota bacterium]|nr:shikimate dehydrogenase [Methylomirabilota bacterium]
MTGLVVLLGHEIGYSASPAMHNAAFTALELDARYELRDVDSGSIADEVAALRNHGRIGANVTQPHKMAVCKLVDELGPEVRRLGAANTILRHGSRLVARNTDLAAIAGELPTGITQAVVLGAGGASRAAAAALRDAGCDQVLVIDRAHWMNLPGALMTARLVVNATPIGTGSDESPLPANVLRPDLRVLDLVYRPSPTRLVREARAAGAPAQGGAGVLLRQAVLSFELWTGRRAPVEVMRDALRGALGAGIDA